MKRYHIYHLPNAVREYPTGEIVHGKVGRSKSSVNTRKRENRKDGLDVTGHEVIAWARTLEEAKMFEQQYQVCYDCVEPIGKWNKNKIHTQESIEKRTQTVKDRYDVWPSARTESVEKRVATYYRNGSNIISEERKKHLSEKSGQAKQCIVNGKVYKSQSAAALDHGITMQAVGYRCNSKHWPDWIKVER
jgi:hypothetical protein